MDDEERAAQCCTKVSLEQHRKDHELGVGLPNHIIIKITMGEFYDTYKGNIITSFEKPKCIEKAFKKDLHVGVDSVSPPLSVHENNLTQRTNLSCRDSSSDPSCTLPSGRAGELRRL